MIIKRPDYRKEIEKAAKQMILIHRVDTLVKMVLRTIVGVLGLEHASLLLYDKSMDVYVAYTSRGITGLKIPNGFARISKDNPIIGYFTDKRLQVFNPDYLLFSRIKDSKNAFHEKLKDQFLLYNAEACIPGFFRNTLIFTLFLGRKFDGRDFTSEELGFMSVLSSDVVMAIRNAQLFQDMNKQSLKNSNLFLQTVFALSSAIEAKDNYTRGHTERVTKYSLIIATELNTMGKIPGTNIKRFLEDLRISSLLHDIGKIGISETILNKEGVLDERDRKEMNKHPLIGANILSKIDELHEPLSGVKYHHERFDGNGYPEGLKGERIPLIARIIAVVDAFDAMTTDRSYRKGFSREEAARLIEKEKGKQFDPVIVDALLGLFKKGKI